MEQIELIKTIVSEARHWRRQLHAFPELLYDLPKTSEFVRRKLVEFGCDEVVSGVAKSGVVAVLKGRLGPGKTIGLRADMDALPLPEETNLPYASKVPGMMHACGHDGHTAMLLAAASFLSVHRDFHGSVALIFQPAEEGGAGALAMIDDGLLDRFGIEEVYAMHNQPGLSVGSFAIRPGPMLAAADRFIIELSGDGGHAAYPHLVRDPVVAGSQLVSALQAIVSRQTDPLDSAVISVVYMQAGKKNALNVIPATMELGGTVRTLKSATRARLERRIREVCASIAASFDLEAAVKWFPGYPVTSNDGILTQSAAEVASTVCGHENVDRNWPISMGAEDFSYMLERRPGALIWLGNGDSASLHSPAYDFNDEAIEWGLKYWAKLVERRSGNSGA